MPTYGYRCTVCAHTFERVQKMTDAALTECESCGGLVKKILYPVGISFKGSGFYVNDYNKPAAKNDKPDGTATSGESKPETKAEGSPAPAADTTPAAATESKPATPAPTPAAAA